MTEIKYGYIGIFEGIPLYTFPSNWMTDFGQSDMELNCAERIAKQKYNEDIVIFINYDICLFKTMVLIFKSNIKAPVYKCFIESDSSNMLPTHEAFEYIIDRWKEEEIDQWREKELELIKPKHKPPLGKLRPIPTCPKCGGAIDLETLICKYCNQEFYVDENN